MKFGAFFVLPNPEWQSESQVISETIEQVEWAEELGYDHIWIGEHHFTRQGIAGNPIQLLSLAAARTRRIRLGLAVSILPFNHPIHLAEQAAMLDVLSNGRLDFGIGRGYLEPEFRGFGIPMSDSTGLFRESFEVIRRAWTEERFSYEGKHYQFEDLRIAPRPVQQPHPPIYVASYSPPSVQWAAEHGLRMMSGGLTPFDELKQVRQHYRDELARHGWDASLYADCPLQRQVFVADSTEEARAITAPALEWLAAGAIRSGTSAEAGTYANDYQYYEKFDRIRRERAQLKWAGDAWDNLETGPIVGDPAEVSRRVSAIGEALDLGYLMTFMGFGGIAHDKVMRSMELFAREVMPRFQSAPTGEPLAAGATA